jgi:hypothetical protein
MADESDEQLPLHDEAKARSEWRGDDSFPDKTGLGSSGPASEVDNAQDEGPGGAGSEDRLLDDIARRPPD